MAGSFELEVITPDRLVFAGAVVSLVAPASDGYLGVLAHHAPLITAITVGEAHVDSVEHGPLYFAVSGGFLHVADNRVVLLADAAERAEEIDVERAEAARRRAEESRRALHRMEHDLAGAEVSLARALNRLRVAQRHGSPLE